MLCVHTPTGFGRAVVQIGGLSWQLGTGRVDVGEQMSCGPMLGLALQSLVPPVVVCACRCRISTMCR